MTRASWLVCGVLALHALRFAPAAHAEQPRDYMLSFQPTGNFALLDYYGTGGILSLEHRRQIFGNSNDLTLGASLIPAFPLAEAQVRADMRILFLGIGGTLSYRTVWRDLVFEPGDHGAYCKDCGRGPRRRMDGLLDDTAGSDAYPIAEGRANLYLPFNEHLVGVVTGALRYEGGHDRAYDWYYTSVYDSGLLERFELQLYLKHPDFGGIGPYVQLLSLPRDDYHYEQWAWGFNAVMRLGILPRNDLLFLTFLIRPGDGIYGQHSYHSPIRALLIYRMIFEL